MDALYFINLNQPGPSRYDLENFQNFDVDNYDPLTSAILNQLTSLGTGGQYTIAGQECRPDQIAQDIYGDTQYWWVIMVYNGITDPEQLVNGMQIQYPRTDLLENYYFALKAQQDAVTP